MFICQEITIHSSRQNKNNFKGVFIMKKKLFKRICAVSLSAIMLTGAGYAGALPFVETGITVNAATVTDFLYTKHGDGYWVAAKILNDTTAYPSTLSIPSTYNNLPVTGINESGFPYYYDNMTIRGLNSVTIPAGVQYIGERAFVGNTGLSDIVIPNSVTYIGTDAFQYTAWLKNKADGDVYAGKVYYQYKGTMPQGTAVTLKNGTKGIAGDAFLWQEGLTSVTIPDTVETIGDEAFYGCTGLQSLTLPQNLTTIGEKAFLWCSNIRSLVIPAGVKEIGFGALNSCSQLEDLTISDGVQKIGNDAFRATALITLTIPGSVQSLGTIFGNGLSTLKTVTLENGVTSISGTFLNCTNLTSVTLPDSLTTIGANTFKNCTSLESIEIPASVTSIDDTAFDNCTWLTIYGVPGSAAETFANAHYIDFVPTTPPVENTSTISADSVRYLSSVKINASATGGSEDYTYAVLTKKTTDADWTTLQDYSTKTAVSFKAPSAGTYKICVKAKDSNNIVAEKTFTLTVFNSLKNTSTAPEAIGLKGSITVNASATGGLGTLKYAVYYKTEDKTNYTLKQSYSTNKVVTIKPSKAATYDICVKVKDSRNVVVKKYMKVKVTTPENTSSLASSTIKLGEKFVLNCSAKDGAGSYQYEVLYRRDSAENWTKKQSYSTNATITLKPAKAETYHFCVRVKDANGNIDKKYLDGVVTAN